MNRKQHVLLALLFFLLTPLLTFVLLYLRGLPEFAAGHLEGVVIWVFGVTWIPALWASVLLTVIVSGITRRTDYFHQPFDFGRSFSLGAIAGALTEAVATGSYRTITHHPFSDFWIAGAMISGCLVGAGLVPLVLSLRRPTKSK